MSSSTLPLFPLSTVLFPGGPLLLRVFEPRYLSLVSRCLRDGHGFGVVLISAGSEVGAAEFVATGTVAEIVDWHQGDDGLLCLTAEGRERFALESFERQPDGLYVGTVRRLEPEPNEPLPEDMAALGELLRALLERAGPAYERLAKHYEDASWVGYRLSEILPLEASVRQSLLELDGPRRRLERLKPYVAELTADERA